jgi:hypothetical protein
MNETIQEIVVVAAVLAAVLYLALRARSKKIRNGSCGCASKKTPPLA